MKFRIPVVAVALAGAGWCFAVQADVAQPAANPYQSIVERNIFGLREPPPPPQVEQPKTPPPNINLTGISTLGTSRAFLKIPASGAKPNQPAKTDQFFMLGEGERDGELEVVEINALLNTVRIKFGDTFSTLDFTNNGVKVAMGAAPPAPGQMQPQPQMPGMPVQALPSRTLRLPTPGGSGYSQPQNFNNGVPNPTGYQQSSYPLPSGGISVPQPYGATTANQQSTGNQITQMPVEHQMLLIEAERRRTESAVAAGLMPPIPPTPLSQFDNPAPQPGVPGQQMQMPTRRYPVRGPGMPPFPQ